MLRRCDRPEQNGIDIELRLSSLSHRCRVFFYQVALISLLHLCRVLFFRGSIGIDIISYLYRVELNWYQVLPGSYCSILPGPCRCSRCVNDEWTFSPSTGTCFSVSPPRASSSGGEEPLFLDYHGAAAHCEGLGARLAPHSLTVRV